MGTQALLAIDYFGGLWATCISLFSRELTLVMLDWLSQGRDLVFSSRASKILILRPPPPPPTSREIPVCVFELLSG